MASESFAISSEQAGQTLAAVVRVHRPGQSWNQARRLVESRHLRLNAELCLDPARRLKEGDTVEILGRPDAPPPREDAIVIRHLDKDLVVVEKPAGLATVRHPVERDWPASRKALTPVLDELTVSMIMRKEGPPKRKHPRPRMRIVQRLDKGTSGLVVFARTVEAERGLGQQFAAHTVLRRYLAIVPGHINAQRIASFLIRDRGDGRRGSTEIPDQGKQAITHIEVVEKLPNHTLVSCRLETGRTHQIRIHLAEKGHPICGEKVYDKDKAGVSRLALHALELGFTHPTTNKWLHWEMPLPTDLARFLDSLRKPAVKDQERSQQ